MKKHTPGPWEMSRDAVPEGIVQITVYAEEDGQRVATVFREEANAHLIAAAPELARELEEATRTLVRALDNMPYLWRRDAKVTGEAAVWRTILKGQVDRNRAILATAGRRRA